jgi:hypothetical protein
MDWFFFYSNQVQLLIKWLEMKVFWTIVLIGFIKTLKEVETITHTIRPISIELFDKEGNGELT